MRNKSKYGEDWQDKIRPAILKRDEYKCRKCGVAHRSYVVKNQDNTYSEITLAQHVVFREEGKKTFRIYLQVAHLDNNTANMDHSNLLSLCAPCHLSNDLEYKQLMRKAYKKQLIQSLGATPIP